MPDMNGTYLFVVSPFLVAAHAMATHQINWTAGMCRIQTIVIGHDLMAFGVGKDLITAKAMAITATDSLVRLATHGIQAILRLPILNLSKRTIFLNSR